MAKAISISLRKFTESVQGAVKAAVAKHPKFKIDAPNAVTVSYLIRGIPVPEAIASAVTMGETQAFAADVAARVASAHPEAFAVAGQASEGAVLSVGRHVLVGIPPVAHTIRLEE